MPTILIQSVETIDVLSEFVVAHTTIVEQDAQLILSETVQDLRWT